jgi:hypothetical protein
MATPLIGIRGDMGAGKDTLAAMIIEDHEGYAVEKFAGTLRRAVTALTGIRDTTEAHHKAVDLSGLVWETEAARGAIARTIETVTAQPADPAHVAKFHDILMEECGAETEPPNYNQCRFRPGTTVGRLLQLLGTECFRQTISDTIWADSLFATASGPGVNAVNMIEARGVNMVVADVRYPNESAAIRARGGVVIHVRRAQAARADGRSTRHLSECALDGEAADVVLENDGTSDELRAALRAAWPRILEIAASR